MKCQLTWSIIGMFRDVQSRDDWPSILELYGSTSFFDSNKEWGIYLPIHIHY